MPNADNFFRTMEYVSEGYRNMTFFMRATPFSISSSKDIDIYSLCGEYAEESGDLFTFVYRERGEKIWPFKVWKKIERVFAQMRMISKEIKIL